jgi:SNF2 family DNA or RNA helicase
LGEVWSLLHFLMPAVFDNHEEFLEWFGGPIEKALQ